MWHSALMTFSNSNSSTTSTQAHFGLVIRTQYVCHIILPCVSSYRICYGVSKRAILKFWIKPIPSTAYPWSCFALRFYYGTVQCTLCTLSYWSNTYATIDLHHCTTSFTNHPCSYVNQIKLLLIGVRGYFKTNILRCTLYTVQCTV